MIKLSDYVMQELARHGLRHIFLLPGGACMHLIDSVANAPELQFTACLHEQACALAAEAYAEYRSGLGAALVTAGPGGTNAVTGVAAAWIEGAACLFLSGQAKRADMIGQRGVRSMGQQELDVVSIVKPITKYAVSITDEKSVRYHLEKAIHLATSGRPGPVWLEIPLDVQAQQIDPEQLEGFHPAVEAAEPAEARLDKLLQLLARSKRPVILLGNGVRAGRATGEFEQFARRLNVPVLTTWKAADLIAESDPLHCGRPGAIGQRGANFTQQNADLIIALGARLDLVSVAFNYSGFARNARKIIVDIDEKELRKFDMKVYLPVCMDVRSFLAEANLVLAAQKDLPDWTTWLRQAREWYAAYPVVLPEYWQQAPGVSTYAFYDVMSELAATNDVLVPGSSGPCSDIFMQAWKVKKGQRIVNAPGLGAMGTGLPGSIGACLSSGRRRTLCFNGDGGFQLNIQELETVRRLGLPIKYFIFCNGGYGSIFSMQKGHFQGRYLGTHPESGFTLPDIAKVAQAYGLPGAKISHIGEVRSVALELLASTGPSLCEIVTPLDERTMPRVTSTVNSDGTITSKPMEDMSPFLDRDELARIMSISS